MHPTKTSTLQGWHLYIFSIKKIAHPDGAVEYIDCFSAEGGKTSPQQVSWIWN